MNGSEAYKEMFESISNAKRRVWMETYIFEPDFIGKKVVDLLTQAKKRGCDVRLIYDALGSNKLTDLFLEDLKNSGASIISFNNPITTWPWKLRNYGFTRNHRKILICDDSVAFTGGMNIGVEYANEDIGGTGL